MDDKQKMSISNQILESIRIKQALLDDSTCIEIISNISDRIIECYREGHKVVLMGNGGSAADAQHIACELVSKFRIERKALPALALNVNTSILTAVGNDYDYDHVFARQVEAWVQPGDIAIGLSTSGNSANVVKALNCAKEIGAFTIAFTGESGGKLASSVDICFKVPSTDTPRIQEAHIIVGHIICDIVERVLFS
jgi:D-sedoheptulose 7-phosphate isomerase